MPYLLDNRLAPLTFSWSFLRAPVDDVPRAYVRWQRLILHRVRKVDVDVALERALAQLQPLDLSCSRVLFQSTRSDWTAVFGNSALGGRPPVAAYMAERLELFDPAFYSGPGVITQSTPWFLPRSPSMTLSEARVRLGID